MLVPTCLRGARRCSRAQWVTTTRSVSSSASADVRHLMAGWSMEVTPQAANKVKGSFGDFLPSNTAVNVTFLPGSDIDETIGVCERLSRDGMRPVPHVAARSLRDHMHLEEYLEGLQRRAGVSEVLVIGGGVTVPVGAFESSMQIAESGLLQKYGITRVGFGAHPEGSPDIPKDALVEAMRAKNAWAHEHRDAVEVYLETQFCFDAKSVFEWDKQMTQEGNRRSSQQQFSTRTLNETMKITASLTTLLFGSALAFAPPSTKPNTSILKAADIDSLPGALPPVGFFDPLGFAEKADAATLKRYREAELTHGRVSMLAVIGFLVGEKVEGSSFLFDASIKGPAITHLSQVPTLFWLILLISIAGLEQTRAEKAFVEPQNVPVGQAGLMREEYVPGDLDFDPLGLKPEDPEEFIIMQTKELQHGRLAMLAAAGFLAQELVDGKGIIEHLSS